jgi:intracellular sulfur oxidation DsrE/DsrF family protein
MKLRGHKGVAAIAARITFTIAAATLAAGALAAGYDDHEALAGVKDLKVAFDITAGDAKMLLGRLNVIDETRRSLIQQGVTPHFVLTFRGPATKLVQTDATKIKPEDREMAAQIAAKLKEMGGAKGVEDLEQCAVAVREQGTKAEDVVAPVKVVGNAWISLMVYQSRGYAYIAP